MDVKTTERAWREPPSRILSRLWVLREQGVALVDMQRAEGTLGLLLLAEESRS